MARRAFRSCPTAWKTHNYSKDAAHAAASGIKAGCDLDCGSTYKQSNLQTALDQSLMNYSDIDLALGRVMRMRFRAGVFAC